MSRTRRGWDVPGQASGSRSRPRVGGPGAPRPDVQRRPITAGLLTDVLEDAILMIEGIGGT